MNLNGPLRKTWILYFTQGTLLICCIFTRWQQQLEATNLRSQKFPSFQVEMRTHQSPFGAVTNAKSNVFVIDSGDQPNSPF